MNKILTLSEIENRLGVYRVCLKAAGGIPRVVLAAGCFDVLHIGHIRHLEAAHKLSSELIACVTPDRFVNKGPGRPVFSEVERAEAVAALECVRYVFINPWQTAKAVIHMLRPDIFVKGCEYRQSETAALAAERQSVEFVGGRLVFTDTPEVHTTELVQKLLATGSLAKATE